MNPYNGCLFGCIYCDARSVKYQMPKDFENKIIMKKNVGEMLDRRLTNARTFLPDVGRIGWRNRLLSACRRDLREYAAMFASPGQTLLPIHLATKSELVLRDLDILDAIGRKSWCSVSVPLPQK